MSKIISEDINYIASYCSNIHFDELGEIKNLGASVCLVNIEYPPGNAEKTREECIEIFVPNNVQLHTAIKIGVFAGLSRVDGRMWSTDVVFEETPTGVKIIYPLA